MIHARQNPVTGRLYEMTYRPAIYSDDVPLDTMPIGNGPWTYDAVNRLAIQVSQATIDSENNLANRNIAISSISDGKSDYKLLRALMLTILDEMNLHANKINAILTAIDNGTTLAQVKANIAAIVDYPQRTSIQIRSVIQNNINSGIADD